MSEDVYERFPMGSYLSPTRYPVDEIERLEGACNHWVTEMETAKWQHTLRHFTNISFLMGNHYSAFMWDQSVNQLTYSQSSANITLPGGIESAIPRTKDNKLIRPYESLISLLTEARPMPRVTPMSSSPTDEDSAKIGEILFDIRWEEMDCPRKLRQVASYLGTMGTAVGEILRSAPSMPFAKPDEEEPETEMVEDAFTGEKVEKERLSKAEELSEFEEAQTQTRANVWSPFEFQPDPGANEDPESMEWCYRHHFADRGWVFENFHRPDDDRYMLEDFAELPEETGREFPIYWFERIKDLIETPEGWSQFSSRMADTGTGFAPNQTLLRVWDMKPNPDFPNGRTIVQAGEKIIYVGDARGLWRDNQGKIKRWHRYAITRYWTIAGRFWGVPLLAECIPLQKKINAIDALQQMNREFLTIGQPLIPRQCNVEDGSLSGIPGMPVYYTAGAHGQKPERMSVPPLPKDLLEERILSERSIERLGSMESLLSTEAPSAVRSSSMLDFMTRKERQAKSPMLQDFSGFIGTMGTNILIEDQVHLTNEDEALTAKIAAAARDRASHVAVSNFVGENLADNVNVSIDMASELLKTPEAKQQRAEAALQYTGADMSPAERTKTYGIMGLEEFSSEESSDFKRAKRMISQIAAGDTETTVPDLEFDDPQIFAPLFKAEVQSDRMVQYPEEVQKYFREIASLYKQEVQRREEEQMKLMMAMQQGGVDPQKAA